MKNVIIIGSGISGLIAANLLAKKGFKVDLYESHFSPGGYTAGFWRKGFYFESGTFSLESYPNLFDILKKLEIFEKISFVRQEIRHVSKDFDTIFSTYEEFKKVYSKAYKNEKNEWEAYFREFDKMYYAFIGESFLKKLATIYYILKNKKVSIEKFTERFFKKGSSSYEVAKKFAFGYPKAPIWMGVFSIISQFNDYWTVDSGMQTLSDVLAKNFEDLGGELHLSSLVEKIVSEKGKVQGIITKGIFKKADIVIAACDYKELFLKLLDDTSNVDIEKIKAAKVSEPVFTVYLGLNMANEELKKYLKVPLVGFEDKNNSFMLYSPSIRNNKLSPEKKSGLMLQMPMPDNWKEIFSSKENYYEKKNKMKDELILKAAKVVPNLREKIELEDAATPFTYERYTHNFEGATSAWSWDMENNFHKSSWKSNINTPIKNLYLGSSWASTFGGIPGAVTSAKACEEKISR